MVRMSCHMTLERKTKNNRGAAHSPHMSAAFTLHPDLPTPPSSPLLSILHEDRLLDIFHSLSERCSVI